MCYCLFVLENKEQGSVAKASSKASSSDVKEVSQKDENDDEDELGKMIEEERSETGRVSNKIKSFIHKLPTKLSPTGEELLRDPPSFQYLFAS